MQRIHQQDYLSISILHYFLIFVLFCLSEKSQNHINNKKVKKYCFLSATIRCQGNQVSRFIWERKAF